jgi:2-dehydro-3-deoxyphosphooctonate aldolase (KDO 8-P synthase)
VEDDDTMLRIAERVASVGLRNDLAVCFKASFDKANRARIDAPRGPGLDAGLRSLERVRDATGLPVLTDVHDVAQVAAVASTVDALQIPAFLCRQTDLLVAAGRSGKPVNIKKGQWMQADGMVGAVEKVRSGGAREIAVTERGTFFGYGDLVVDHRNFALLREATGCPALYDATHSVQQPGRATGGASGGLREHIPALLAAAAAAGADGFFLETHPDPDRALSDAATQWPLDRLEYLMERTLAVWHAARERVGV